MRRAEAWTELLRILNDMELDFFDAIPTGDESEIQPQLLHLRHDAAVVIEYPSCVSSSH